MHFVLFRIVHQVELFDKLGKWEAADGRWGILNRKKRSPDGVDQIQQANAVPCPFTFDQVDQFFMAGHIICDHIQYNVIHNIASHYYTS